MEDCAHEAYAATRATLASSRAPRNGKSRSEKPVDEARLRLIRDGYARGPARASDFKLLAEDDVARRIPVRAKIHICRACRRCEPFG